MYQTIFFESAKWTDDVNKQGAKWCKNEYLMGVKLIFLIKNQDKKRIVFMEAGISQSIILSYCFQVRHKF